MSVEREFRQVLAELELLSHGKTQSFDAMAKGENPDPKPFGELKPPHEGFRIDYERCETDQDRQATLGEAREYLESWKGLNRAQQAQEWDEERWIIEDGEGFEAVEVARRFNTSAARVRKLRLKHNRDGEFGKPYVEPVEVDRTERVLFLLDKQMSVRAVAQQVGMHSTQVQRIKARRAA